MKIYKEVVARTNLITNTYQILSRQINNAAVLRPQLLLAERKISGMEMFHTDASQIFTQLEILRSTVQDASNIQVSRQLDSLIKKELPWIISSNVPDSIVNHTGVSHLSSLRQIDSLTSEGMKTTQILLADNGLDLNHSIKWLSIWMTVFIILAGSLLAFAISNMVRQRAKKTLTEERLVDSESRFRALIENSNDIITISDASLKLLYRAPSFTRLTGWTDNEQTELTGFSHVHPDDLGSLKNVISEAKAYPGKPIEYLFRYQHKNGKYIWLEGSATNWLADDTINGIIFNSREVTTRIELERLLSKAGNLARIGSWEFEVATEKVYWSKIAEEIFETPDGYQPETEKIAQLYRTDRDRQLMSEKVRAAIDYGHPFDVEVQVVTAKNNDRWIRIIGEAEFAGLTCIKVAGSFQDITGHIKAQEDLLKVNRHYEFSSAISQSIIRIKEANLLLQNVCGIAVRIGKYKLPWIGLLNDDGTLNVLSFCGDETMDRLVKERWEINVEHSPFRHTPVGQALRTGEYALSNDTANDPAMQSINREPIQAGIRSTIAFPLKKSGTVIGVFALNAVIPGYFDKAEIAFLQQSVDDVCFGLETIELEIKRQQAERQMKESEEKYRTAQQIGRMGHWELDLADNTLFWSEEIYLLFGLGINSIAPDFETFLSFVHPEDREYLIHAQQLAIKGIKAFDLVHRIVVNGSIRYMHEAGDVMKDENGRIIKFAGMVQDITEQYLVEEDNRFKAELLKTIGQAVMATDLGGKIIYWNKAAEEMYGWKAEEALGKNILEVTPSFQTKEQAALIMQELVNGKTWSGEFLVRRKDGTDFPVYITDAPIYDNAQKLSGVIGVSTDISQRKKHEELLVTTNEELRVLSAHLLNIREDERKHVAREIHDELGQQLTALKMDISWLNRKLALTDVEHKEKMAGIFRLIDRTVETVRKIASELRPAMLDDLGLEEAIRWQIKEFIKHTGIAVSFSTNVEEQLFSPDITTGAFRIFQESLTNIARHARATVVTCGLMKSDHHLLLTVTDNGIGFIEDSQTRKGSFGLLGLKERIDMLDGTYEISSELNMGTALLVTIPLP